MYIQKYVKWIFHILKIQGKLSFTKSGNQLCQISAICMLHITNIEFEKSGMRLSYLIEKGVEFVLPCFGETEPKRGTKIGELCKDRRTVSQYDKKVLTESENVDISSVLRSSISSISSGEEMEDSAEMAEMEDFGTKAGRKGFEATETLMPACIAR